MKFVAILTFASLSFGAMAQDLATMKNEANTHLDQKMASLQTAKSCVNNASTVEKFKACKYDMHESMKKQKMQMMQEKQEKPETLE